MRPTSTHNKILKGTLRPCRVKPKPASIEVDSVPKPLRCPTWVKGEHRQAWKDLVAACDAAELDLDASDAPAMAQASSLYAQMKSDPTGFSASKHGQLRSLFRSLGLLDVSPQEET